MRARAWICTLFAALMCGICPSAYSSRYLVILEVHSDRAQLHLLQARKLLDLEWRQLALIPLHDAAVPVSDILKTVLPTILPKNTKFMRCFTQDDTLFFTCLPGTQTGKTAYISWLVNHPSPAVDDRTVHTLYKQLLSTSPMATLNEIQPGITVHTTDTPNQFTIKAKLSRHSNRKKFLLSNYIAEQSQGYTLTPLAASAGIEASLIHQLGAMTISGDMPQHPFKKPQPVYPKPPMSPPIPIPHASTEDPIQPDSTKTIVPHSYVQHDEGSYLTLEQLQAVEKNQRQELLEWVPVTTLSQTRFGTVQLYKKNQSSKEHLVIKKINTREKKFPALSREVSFLHEIKHEHIISFQGIAISQPHSHYPELWLALEYIPQGDMSSQLSKNPQIFTDENIQIIIKGIVKAIQYLHGRHIAHRDIKPDNILLAFEKAMVEAVKVSDFGLATAFGIGKCGTMYCGSPGYAAPEILNRVSQYDADKTDIWGFGITLHVIYTHQDPHPEAPSDREGIIDWRIQNPHKEVGSEKSLKKLRKAKSKPPADAIDLVRQCCDMDPGKRPDINTVARNPFVQRPEQPEPSPSELVTPRKSLFKRLL